MTGSRVSLLFRTEGWNFSDKYVGRTFYLLKELDIDETQFADNIADEDLDTSLTIVFSNVPQWCHQILQSNNRLFVANFRLRRYTPWKPWYVASGHGSNQTVNGITYADGYVSSTRPNPIVYADVANTSGLTADKYYQYGVTYIDIEGNESDMIYGEVFHAGGFSGFRKVTITWLPYGEIGANGTINNPQLRYRKIYRTAGQGSSFASGSATMQGVSTELISHDDIYDTTATKPNTVFEFEDTTDDGSLGVGTSIKYDTYASGLAFSEAEKPAFFKSENIRQVFEEDQNEITALIDDGNGILIFKANGIIKLYNTSAPDTWYIRKIWENTGCDDSRSIIKVGSTIFFSYRNKIYSYVSGSAPQYIGHGKQKSWDDSTIISVTATDTWVAWLVSQSTTYKILVWDRKLECWYDFDFSTNVLSYLSTFRYGSREGQIITGRYKVYGYDDALTQDYVSGSATDVNATIELPRVIVDETTPFKIRDMVIDSEFVTSKTVTLTLINSLATYSPISISGSGLVRITGGGNKAKAQYYRIKLTGGLKKLFAFRAELRPVRRGVGAI